MFGSIFPIVAVLGNAFKWTIAHLLPPFPTYTLVFLPRMPLRFPPRSPTISFALPLSPSFIAYVPPVLHLLPEKCVLAAVSLVVVAVGLGVTRRSYRVHQALSRPKNSTIDPLDASREGPEGKNLHGLEHRPSTKNAPPEACLKLPLVEVHKQPTQLFTPPQTPPHPLQHLRPTPLTPAAPQLRPSPGAVSPSPMTLTFPSPASSPKQECLQSKPDPPPPSSRNPSAKKANLGDPNTLDEHAPITARMLPPNLAYTNTSYATLLRAQRFLTYEQTRRASLETEARAQLGAVLRVYWSGCRARAYSKGRRGERAKLNGLDDGESHDEEVRDRERREAEVAKENMKSLQLRVQRLREERVPYEDVLRPPCPHARHSYNFQNGKLTTLPSTAIPPSYLLTILSGTIIASSVEDIDVSLRLWAGWEWDVEVEWELEVMARCRGAIREQNGRSHKEEYNPAMHGKRLNLPTLRKVAISTTDVPLGSLFERIALPPGSLETVRIRVEDGCVARKVKLPSINPAGGSTTQPRRNGSSEDRMKRMAGEKMAICLDGLDATLRSLARDFEVYGPESVEGPWVKGTREASER